MQNLVVVDIRKYFEKKEKIMKEDSKISKKPIKFSVTEVKEKKNGYINPVIVVFQNGELIENGSDFNVTFTANKNGETKIEVNTLYEHVFKDPNCSERARPKQTILIRNRKTNKVRIVEVDSAVLINSALLSSSQISLTPTNLAKETKNLNRTFGGKKVVAKLEQREKLHLSSLPIADDVKKAVADIKVEESVSFSEIETESIINLLPPCHRNAASVSEVYVISEILTEEELQDLKNEMSGFEKKKFNPQDYSEFFMDCYAEAKKSKENLDIRLAGLLFAEVLIKFLKIQSKKLAVKNMVLCSFSSAIQEKLFNEFCIKTETSITRPVTMRDKSLCYIMAVSLICCNYKVNLKLLSACTSVHLSRLVRMARAVGAVPISKEDHIFILKLPLPDLPRSSKGRIKRK